MKNPARIVGAIRKPTGFLTVTSADVTELFTCLSARSQGGSDWLVPCLRSGREPLAHGRREDLIMMPRQPVIGR
jgi:hypothetical protein